MKRTGAAELIPAGLSGLKPKEVQNFRHRHERTNLAKVDPRHGCSSNREEEPVRKDALSDSTPSREQNTHLPDEPFLRLISGLLHKAVSDMKLAREYVVSQ